MRIYWIKVLWQGAGCADIFDGSSVAKGQL